MAQRALFIVLAIAIVNGIFSPATFSAVLLHPLWYPAFLPRSLPLLLLASSLLTATLTVMLSGIPAALFERVSTAGQSSHAANLIWIATCSLLTVPALQNALAALD